jgi:hypothetical protein
VTQSSSKLASWLAIFSLVFSSFLTLTHYHAGNDCGCSDHTHAQSAVIAGLETLQQGDCECIDCDAVPQHENQQHENHEHDEDSCSICRMLYEHAVQSVEFSIVEFEEPCCDFVVQVFSAPKLSTVSGYLTRGPPALNA